VPSVFGTAGLWCIPLFYEQGYDPTSISILIGWSVLFNALLVGVMSLDRAISGRMNAANAKRAKEG
jgi:hypothetical protein